MVERSFNLGAINLCLALGASYNISQKIGGKIADDTLNISNISDFESYNKKSNVIGFASIGLDYSISKHWNIIATSRYYHGRNLTMANSEFDHSFSSINVSLGVGFMF